MTRLTRPRIVRTDSHSTGTRLTLRGVDHTGQRIQRTVIVTRSTREQAKLDFLAKLQAKTPDHLEL